MKAPSKYDQQRAMREANYVTRVTKPKDSVTKLMETLADLPPVKWKKPGRPRKHATGAERAKAYRARRNGNG